MEVGGCGRMRVRGGKVTRTDAGVEGDVEVEGKGREERRLLDEVEVCID